jgi:helicase
VIRNGREIAFDNIMNNISVRIKHGIKEELLDLMENLNVSRNQARILFNNGFETSESLYQFAPILIHKKTGISLDKLRRIISGTKESLIKNQKSILDYAST